MVDPLPPACLDTSVLSQFFKRNSNRAELYRPDMEGRERVISFVTVAEMYRWALQKRWEARNIERLERTFRSLVILPYHTSVALQWARIQTSTPKSENDAWIAACALAYGCILLTDDKGFQGIQGLTIISHADEGRS